MIILVKNYLESFSRNKVLRTSFAGYYECKYVVIKGIGRFIRKVYKKHYWKFKFLPPQLSEATYTPADTVPFYCQFKFKLIQKMIVRYVNKSKIDSITHYLIIEAYKIYLDKKYHKYTIL